MYISISQISKFHKLKITNPRKVSSSCFAAFLGGMGGGVSVLLVASSSDGEGSVLLSPLRVRRSDIYEKKLKYSLTIQR